MKRKPLRIDDPVEFARWGEYDLSISGVVYQGDDLAQMTSLVKRMSVTGSGSGKRVGTLVRSGDQWTFFHAHRMDVVHAPKGGVNIQGKFYPGGEFIPGNVMAKASPEEKGKLERKSSDPEKQKSVAEFTRERGQRIGSRGKKNTRQMMSETAKAYASADVSPPPPGRFYSPDVENSTRRDGITDAARVGVPGSAVPPPPSKIPRLPKLEPHERAVEEGFARAFENAPNKVSNAYREAVLARSQAKGAAPTFETDEAKELSDDWNDDVEDVRLKKRATYNLALHATANAIAKRAFVKHLDTLTPGDTVLVTCGGCGSGKGFATKQASKMSPEIGEAVGSASVIWDSAGDQNGTESPWVLEECRKRGLKMQALYVHADPTESWSHEKFGVVERAKSNGRMVDAKVFADSYAVGAKNHHKFHQVHQGDDDVSFIFIHNKIGESPKILDGVPEDSLKWTSNELARQAVEQIHERKEGLSSPHIFRSAVAGTYRVWKGTNG